VNGIETFIHDNGGFIAGLRLQQCVTNPVNPQSIADVQQILKSAEKSKVAIPLDVVEYAGTKFMEVSQSNPSAWDAALSVVDYRSFLNAELAPTIPHFFFTTSPEFTVKFAAAKLPNPSEAMLGVAFDRKAEMASGSQSALFVKIGEEAQVVKAPREFLVEALGYNIALDHYHVKNVIIRDAKITYTGGPLILENVYFVNCTFEISQQANGQEFAKSLLNTSSVIFRADGYPLHSGYRYRLWFGRGFR